MFSQTTSISISLVVLLLVGSVWYFLNHSSLSTGYNTRSPMGTNMARECQIIAIGDSITSGYDLDQKDAYPAKLQDMLQENGYSCSVINAGVSGDTSKGLLDRLDFTL